jgi:hypothetical protein
VFLMEFDGLHNVQMLALDVLDGVGSFYYRADVPPGFGSHDVVLQGFYCGDPSRGRGVADSTRVAIRLR